MAWPDVEWSDDRAPPTLVLDVAPVVVLGLLTFLTGDTDQERQDVLVLVAVVLPLRGQAAVAA